MDASFWQGKRVLVTGHTGFKGSWLCLWLEHLGARVAGFALNPATVPALWTDIGESAVVSTIGDIRDSDALAVALSKLQPEVVFHLAAQSLVHASYEDPVGTYATNVMGTVHLLEAVRQVPSVRAVVNITSDKCYENRESGQAYREGDPMGGGEPYSSSKGCAELVTHAYRASFFSKPGAPAIASARAGNVIGGGDWARDRLIPDVVRATTSGEPVKIRRPQAVRPWQHVLEPLAGYLRLAEQLVRNPDRFARAWNFGPDNEDAVPVQKILNTVTELWGPPAAWKLDDKQYPPEAHFLRLDSSDARAMLGWRPRLGLPNALAWTVDWYKRYASGESARELTIGQIRNYMGLSAR